MIPSEIAQSAIKTDIAKTHPTNKERLVECLVVQNQYHMVDDTRWMLSIAGLIAMAVAGIFSPIFAVVGVTVLTMASIGTHQIIEKNRQKIKNLISPPLVAAKPAQEVVKA